MEEELQSKSTPELEALVATSPDEPGDRWKVSDDLPDAEIGRRMQDFVKTSALAGRKWEDTAEQFRSRFGDSDPSYFEKDYSKLGQQAKLEAVHFPAAVKEEQQAQATEPWSLARLTNTSYEHSANLRHWLPLGGTVMDVQAARAQKRLDSGEATDDDLQLLARHRVRSEVDAARESGMTPGQRLGNRVASIPGQIAPLMAGAPVAAALTPARVAGAAGLAGFAGQVAAEGVLNPAFSVQSILNSNLEAGRDPFDYRGVGPGLASAVVQAGVLKATGILGGKIGGAVAPESGELAKTISAGAVGPVSQQIADLATYATGLSSHYGALDDLAHGRKGDALAKVVNDAITFGVFHAMHGGPESGRSVVDSAVEALNASARTGLPAPAAAARLGEAAQVVARAADPRPGDTPEAVRARVEAASGAVPKGPARDYAGAVGDALAPPPVPEGVSPGRLEELRQILTVLGVKVGKRAKPTEIIAEAKKLGVFDLGTEKPSQPAPAEQTEPATAAPETPAAASEPTGGPEVAQQPPEKPTGQPEAAPRLIDVRKVIEDSKHDVAAASVSIAAKVKSHLEAGGSASLWVDGKETPVTVNGAGRLVGPDGAGVGIMPAAQSLPGTKAGVELKPPPEAKAEPATVPNGTVNQQSAEPPPGPRTVPHGTVTGPKGARPTPRPITESTRGEILDRIDRGEGGLTDTEKLVLRDRLVFGTDFREIGDTIGKSYEAARQIEGRALKKLGHTGSVDELHAAEAKPSGASERSAGGSGMAESEGVSDVPPAPGQEAAEAADPEAVMRKWQAAGRGSRSGDYGELRDRRKSDLADWKERLDSTADRLTAAQKALEEMDKIDKARSKDKRNGRLTDAKAAEYRDKFRRLREVVDRSQGGRGQAEGPARPDEGGVQPPPGGTRADEPLGAAAEGRPAAAEAPEAGGVAAVPNGTVKLKPGEAFNRARLASAKTDFARNEELIRQQGGRTIYRDLSSRGGIDPRSVRDVGLDLKAIREGPLKSLFRKGGAKIDEVLDEYAPFLKKGRLGESGTGPSADDLIEAMTNHVRLEGGKGQDAAFEREFADYHERQKGFDALEEEVQRAREQARRSGVPERDFEESLRAGEEAGAAAEAGAKEVGDFDPAAPDFAPAGTSVAPRGGSAAGRLVRPAGKGHPAYELAESALRAAPGLTDAQRAAYGRAAKVAIDAMPEAARDALAKGTKGVRFHPSSRDIGRAMAEQVANDPSVSDSVREVLAEQAARWEATGTGPGGAYFRGVLHIDGDHLLGEGWEGRYVGGGTMTAAQVYGHEFGHGIDGEGKALSGTPAWKAAYDAELSRGGGPAEYGPDGVRQPRAAPLSSYAYVSPAEGFAEAARVLYGTDYSLALFARHFPRVARFFKDNGLWPAERSKRGRSEAVPEAFSDRVSLGGGSDHIDVLAKSADAPQFIDTVPDGTVRGERVTSTKRATVDREREELGLPPIPSEPVRGWETLWERAGAKAESNPGATDRLIAELKERPRTTEDAERADLLYRRVELGNRIERLSRALESTNPDPAAQAQAEHDFNDAVSQRGTLDGVLRSSGTEAGRALNAIRMAAKEDFSLVRMLAEARAAKGSDLTPTERTEIRATSLVINHLEGKLGEGQGGGPGDGGGKIGTPQQEGDRFTLAGAKRRFRERIDGYKAANTTPMARALANVGEAMNFSRSLLLGFDLPPLFRQAGFVTMGRPLLAGKAFLKSFGALTERGAFDAMRQIDTRENSRTGLYKRAGVEFTTPEGHLSQHEESFASKWLGKVPVMRELERTHTAFLNRVRADLFDTLAASLGRGGKVSDAEARVLGNFVNVATGRGNLGSFQPAGNALAKVFLAPRWVVSRFQMLGGQPLWRGDARTRALVAGEYARFAVGMGVLYGLAKAWGAEEESDPRATDFGRLKLANTRLDPTASLGGPATLVARLASGQAKSAAGKVSPIRGKVPYGGQDAAEVIGHFLRTKLAPIPGALVDVAAGKDVVGDPVTPGSVAARQVTPIAARDAYEVMTEKYGLPAKVAANLLGSVGMNVSVYQKHHPQPAKR